MPSFWQIFVGKAAGANPLIVFCCGRCPFPADAYRESYLGHSQFAPVGRWQKGKDILWYTKKHGDSKEHIPTQTVNPGELQRRAEIAAIKAQEEDLLNQVFASLRAH